jgi:hypothetical protein
MQGDPYAGTRRCAARLQNRPRERERQLDQLTQCARMRLGVRPECVVVQEETGGVPELRTRRR